MVYSASNAPAPRTRVSGPVSYRTPYVGNGCGCAAGKRESFRAEAVAPAAAPAQSMCTLTATPPPPSCCSPSPLHCDSGCSSGYFNASEAYGA